MTLMWSILSVCAVLAPLAFLGIIMDGFGGSQYTPMSYDEEMRWLMEDHGLTWEEADEYASLPYHRT